LTAGPGIEGSAALAAYLQHPPEDSLLLMSIGKLDQKSEATNWFKAVNSSGVVIKISPLEGKALEAWLTKRMQQRGLFANPAGVGQLAERIEGNLLVAEQEIENLYTLYGAGKLTTEQILSAVADNSQYDVFNLTDALLDGKIARAKKILERLQAKGTPEPVVLWLIARDARLLNTLKHGLAKGQSQDSLFKTYRIWGNNQSSFKLALKRLKLADINRILVMCAKADRQSKGQQQGDAWDTLWKILLVVCRI